MDESIRIRPAREDDLPRLTEIYNHYIVDTPVTFHTDTYSVERRREEWFVHYGEQGRHRLLVADRDGAVVGYTSASRHIPRGAYDTTVETTIICAPGETGKGIGSALYRALFDALTDEDVHMAVAGVTLPNEASCAIHERFGFERVGVYHEVGRKFGKYWDVAWYEKRLR